MPTWGDDLRHRRLVGDRSVEDDDPRRVISVRSSRIRELMQVRLRQAGRGVTPAGRAGCGYGGFWSCRGSMRWWCRRGSGPGSSPTGGSRPGGGRSRATAVFSAGLAAVGLVPDVVHLARRGGLVAAASPPAVLVAQGDGVADPGRDGLGVADVQRQARAAQPGAELPAAQERRQPARPGQQVDGLADNGLLEGLPGPRGVRGQALPPGTVPAPSCAAGAVAGWWRSRSSWTHSRTRSSRAPGVHLAGHERGHRRVAGHRARRRRRPATRRRRRRRPRPAARCPAHCARTRAVHSSSSAELPSSTIRSASEMCTQALTGCPARSGSSPAATSRRMRPL